MFVDIGEGRAGTLGTPGLREPESYESIAPSFPTPRVEQVDVIHITWQVETKLATWFSGRKNSDFEDLKFLLVKYAAEIAG
ncbi:hypothetical protein PABG_04725 [Paracoccidioides brasiliensis Pb03]|uniref:Uncharacterized protein n=2 Tax=Paracoccidioides brasiliensis TaxID=121759 RepID=A0A0A0HTF0_PARBD|nr:uncharacterized protein PADG_11917 [Paracoccidioides brasiliensis Pb18]EEH22514.2 hypothetical protein PABG_04725 [Paracoccidioides brasiliensis Pb03]KGM91942.1 hypothetical protein PADG_11917 [Paracoccidioides brasiliensis Pb18]ODH27299.1 hypothetical protein ACO22_04226 [Paracoccidioides brasiliensis]